MIRRIRIDPIAHPLCIPAIFDEPIRFKHTHVPRHAGLTGPELIHQFAHAMLPAIGYEAECAEPSWFSQSRENRNNAAPSVPVCVRA